jgi:hypothetical protein
MITVKDIQKAKDFPRACKDERGALRVGAAVGTGGDTDERVAALVEAGVDVIVVDTSHGHSRGVLETGPRIKQRYPDMQVIGGNIVTAEAARRWSRPGADGVKVGIGPARSAPPASWPASACRRSPPWPTSPRRWRQRRAADRRWRHPLLRRSRQGHRRRRALA